MSFAMVQSYYIHCQWMCVCVCGSLLAFNAELHSISCRFFLSRLVLWKCIECKNRSENFSFAISSILLAGFHRRKSLMRRKCKTWTLDCVLIVYFSCIKNWGALIHANRSIHKHGQKSDEVWFRGHSTILLEYWLQCDVNRSDEWEIRATGLRALMTRL